MIAVLFVFYLRVHAPADLAPGWLEQRVQRANELFAPFGVRFEVDERRAFSPRALESREDRDALGTDLDPSRIDLFVVESLRDVDDPTQMRRGVHWRLRRDRGVRFIVLSKIAGEYVLAHELGHYFGNPHSSTPSNVMSYERGESSPFFDDVQGRRIRASARRFEALRTPTAHRERAERR